MDYQNLVVTAEGATAVITLNRPQRRNALSLELMLELKGCLDEIGRGQSIQVVSDPVQPKGGVVFELSSGLLDASVDTQLAEIERGLTDQLEAHA